MRGGGGGGAGKWDQLPLPLHTFFPHMAALNAEDCHQSGTLCFAQTKPISKQCEVLFPQLFGFLLLFGPGGGVQL